MQNGTRGWKVALARCQPGTWHKFFEPGLCAEAKAARRSVKTLYRHYVADQEQWLQAGDKAEATRRFFSELTGGEFRRHAAHIDGIEELNEYVSHNAPAERLAAAIDWAVTAMRIWQEEFRSREEFSHIRLICGSVAVGNDVPIELARAAVSYDAILSYHAYIPVREGQPLAGEFEHYSGRWIEMDERFRRLGLQPEWLLGECGVVGYERPGVMLRPEWGWRHEQVFNGDFSGYLEVMRKWWRRIEEWNRTHRRLLGGSLFTSSEGIGEQWRHFQHSAEQVAQLNEIAGGEPAAVASGEIGRPREQYRRVFNVIPGHYGEEKAVAIFRQAWRQGRQSTGGSYDDAGVGALNRREARLFGIPAEHQGRYESWYATHYPGVAVIFAESPYPLSHWPVTGRQITQHFGVNGSYYARFGLPGHEGVDLAGHIGDAVFAAAEGVVQEVRSAGASHNYGNFIRVRHERGYVTTYAHLSEIEVGLGQHVRGGQQIGRIGSSGNSSGPHLHFGMSGDAGQADWPRGIINPEPYLALLEEEK